MRSGQRSAPGCRPQSGSSYRSRMLLLPGVNKQKLPTVLITVLLLPSEAESWRESFLILFFFHSFSSDTKDCFHTISVLDWGNPSCHWRSTPEGKKRGKKRSEAPSVIELQLNTANVDRSALHADAFLCFCCGWTPWCSVGVFVCLWVKGWSSRRTRTEKVTRCAEVLKVVMSNECYKNCELQVCGSVFLFIFFLRLHLEIPGKVLKKRVRYTLGGQVAEFLF